MSIPPPYHDNQPPTMMGQPGPENQTVIIQTSIDVGPNPSLVQCPNCLASVMTSVEYQTSQRTHLWALCLCLTMMWPCIFIPYCCCGGTCRKAVHTCPNCKFYIGTH